MEYRHEDSPKWTVDADTITGTTHTLDELRCGSWHQIRVSAYGNGTIYAAAWGDQSVFLEVITDTCVLPEFGASSYTFSVADAADVGASVGTVSATIAGGDAVSYSIYLKNENDRYVVDERFVIDSGTGEITLAEALDYATTSSYTLRVAASVEKRGIGYAEVNVSVLPSCPSGAAAPDPACAERPTLWTLRPEDPQPLRDRRVELRL